MSTETTDPTDPRIEKVEPWDTIYQAISDHCGHTGPPSELGLCLDCAQVTDEVVDAIREPCGICAVRNAANVGWCGMCADQMNKLAGDPRTEAMVEAGWAAARAHAYIDPDYSTLYDLVRATVLGALAVDAVRDPARVSLTQAQALLAAVKFHRYEPREMGDAYHADSVDDFLDELRAALAQPEPAEEGNHQ